MSSNGPVKKSDKLNQLQRSWGLLSLSWMCNLSAFCPSPNFCKWQILFFSFEILELHILRKYHTLVWKWTLHHDNAHPHVDVSVPQYFSKCIINIIPYPFSNQYVSPDDFWLSSNLKEKHPIRKNTANSQSISAVYTLKYIPEKLLSTCFENRVE